MNHRIIITGGPGAGKTSLLEALVAKGYRGMPEVSRRLIQQEVAANSRKLPWQDLPAFAALCLEAMLADYQQMEAIAFYDRGIPDVLGYMQAAGLKPNQELLMAAYHHPYCPLAFIAPPWKDIYKQDEERWQSFEEAIILHRYIQGVYTSLGYRLVELPLVSVAQRVVFIEKQMESWSAVNMHNLC